MSSKQLRINVQAALRHLATGDLATSTTALLKTLGYSSNKTTDLPAQPTAFAKELEALVGGTRQLNPVEASLPDWKSAAFLFQLTNDELPALAAGQPDLLGHTSGMQAHQVESFVFIAIDLKARTWSRLTWPSSRARSIASSPCLPSCCSGTHRTTARRCCQSR